MDSIDKSSNAFVYYSVEKEYKFNTDGQVQWERLLIEYRKLFLTFLLFPSLIIIFFILFIEVILLGRKKFKNLLLSVYTILTTLLIVPTLLIYLPDIVGSILNTEIGLLYPGGLVFIEVTSILSILAFLFLCRTIRQNSLGIAHEWPTVDLIPTFLIIFGSFQFFCIFVDIIFMTMNFRKYFRHTEEGVNMLLIFRELLLPDYVIISNSTIFSLAQE
jgi:hypothetical protein